MIRRQLADLVTGRTFTPVRSTLAPDDWLTVPNDLTFGFPWPWRPMPQPAAIVDAEGNQTSQAVIGAVHAPRATGVAEFLLWQAKGEFDAVLPRLDARLAQLYGAAIGRIRPIRLDGYRAAVAEVAVPDGTHVFRLVTADPRGRLTHGELRTPQSAVAGYRPHFDTMLASWKWL